MNSSETSFRVLLKLILGLLTRCSMSASLVLLAENVKFIHEYPFIDDIKADETICKLVGKYCCKKTPSKFSAQR